MNERETYFTRLYIEYKLLVFNRIHQFISDYHTCEDLTQETFARARESFKRNYHEIAS